MSARSSNILGFALFASMALLMYIATHHAGPVGIRAFAVALVLGLAVAPLYIVHLVDRLVIYVTRHCA